MNAESIWRKNICSLDEHRPGMAEVYSTISSLVDELSKNGPCAVDLGVYQAEELNLGHAAAVLRCTYSCRDNIVGWSDLLNAATKAFEDHGYDPQRMLKGLYS